MPSVFLPATAEDCFNAARMFLNDNGIPTQLWTDAILLPMMKQAHLELQVKLKQRASPAMRGYQTVTLVPLEIDLIPLPVDLVLPIKLWEKPAGSPAPAFQPMTETDMLPFVLPSTTLTYWMWDQDAILFIGSTIATDVFVDYWRRVPVPVAATDDVGILEGEQFLGPRIAAIAAGSVGEENTSSIANALAETQLQVVLAANKSRAAQAPGVSLNP